MLASKRRCALHCAFSSFMWKNTQGWNITSHPWAHKHKITVLWCLATWLLQDYDQDARATQKTVTHQFDHLFHSHNHIICDCRQRNSFDFGSPQGKEQCLCHVDVWTSPAKLFYHLRDRIMPGYGRCIHRGFSRHCYCSRWTQPHTTTAQFYHDLCHSHLPTEEVMASQAWKTIF